MTESITIECPQCHARGELSDPRLFGQSIACPACQAVFVAPTPLPPAQPPLFAQPQPVIPSGPAAGPMDLTGFPVVTNPQPTVPAMEFPVPQEQAAPAAFPTEFPSFGNAPTVPGATSIPAANTFASDPALVPMGDMFGAGLPEPSMRGSIRPPKQQSKLLQIIIRSSVSAVVLFAFVMFLMGDPWRGMKEKIEARKAVQTAQREEIKNDKRARSVPPSAKRNARNDVPSRKSEKIPDPPTMAATAPTQPGPAVAETTPAKPAEPMPTPPATPAEAKVTVSAVDSYVPPSIDGSDGTETQENIPREAKAKLDDSYGDAATPRLVELLSYAHAGVRSQAASNLCYHNATPSAVAPLLKLMQDPEPRVRIAAANALRVHGVDSTDVIPLLGAVLQKDPVHDVRSAAANTLKELAKGDAARASAVATVLIPALRNAREDDIPYIGAAFGPLGAAAQPAIPQLVRLLKNERCAPSIAAALAELGQIEPLEQLLAKQTGDGYSVKTGIAEGLGRQKAMTAAMLPLLKTIAEDKQEYVRRSAIQALQSCQPKIPEALPLLEQAQGDADSGVRSAAAEAMAGYEVDPNQQVRRLLSQFMKARKEDWERSTIADAIRKLSGKGLRSLVGIMAEQDSPLRDAAAQVAAEGYWDRDVQEAETIEGVRKLLADPERSLAVRASCAILLRMFESRMAEIDPTLKQAVVNEELEVGIRERSATMIDRMNPDVIRFFNDIALKCEQPLPEDATDQIKANRNRFYQSILGLLGAAEISANKQDHSAVLARFLTAVQIGSPDVKSAALWQLRELGKGSPEVVELSRSMLTHESHDVRRNALQVLGVMHDKAAAAIPEIRALLDDKDRYLGMTAAEALGQFGPAAAEAIPDLLAALNSDDNTRVSSVAQAAAKIAPQDENVQAALIRELGNPERADGVLQGLLLIGPGARGAVPKLRELLPTAKKSEAQVIFLILGKLGPDATPALPEMIQRLADADQWTQNNALAALGQMKAHAQEAVPEIAKLLSNPNPEVQSGALNALRRIGPAAKAALPDVQTFESTTTAQHLKIQARSTINRISADPADADGAVYNLISESENVDDLIKELSADPATSFPALARLSGSTDDNIRYRALGLLNAMVSKPVSRDLLQKLLDGDDVRSQALAAVLLRRLPTKEDHAELIRELIPWMKNESTASVSTRLLSRLGPDGLAAISNMLTGESTSSKTRRELLDRVVYELNPRRRQLIASLRQAMQSDSPAVKDAAALVLARIEPREPDILPVVLKGLSSPDVNIRYIAATDVAVMAEDEVDVSASIPELMKCLVADPQALKARSPEAHALFQAAARAIEVIGAKSEQLPELQKMLRVAIENSKDSENQDVFIEYGMFAVHAISTLGPQAAKALPEIKELIIRSGNRGYSYQLSRIGEPAVEMLSGIARDANLDVQARRAALQILRQMTDDDLVATPVFVELLKSPEAVMQTEAALALVRVPEQHEAALAVLREILKGTDKNEQLMVVQQLGFLGAAAAPALPEILELANRSEQWRQGTFASALFEIAPDNPQVHAVILDTLKSQSWSFDEPKKGMGITLIPRLIEAVEKESDPLRMRAAELLGMFDDQASDAVPALRDLMTSDQGESGFAAAVALAQIDPTAADAVPRLTVALDNPRTRYKANDGLRHLGPNAAEALPKLIELINSGADQNDSCRTIGRMGSAAQPALPLLVARLSDDQFAYSAAEALFDLGDQAAQVAPQLIALLREGHSSYRIPEILTKMGQPAVQAVELLMGDLDKPDSQAEVIEQLKHFGDLAEPATAKLIDLAKGMDRELRIASLDALGSIKKRATDTVPLLAAALADPDPRVVMTAAGSLTELADSASSAMPQIVTALEQNRERTRWQLLHLIREMGPAAKDAVPALEKLAQTPELNTRRMAKATLKAIQEPAKAEKAQ